MLAGRRRGGAWALPGAHAYSPRMKRVQATCCSLGGRGWGVEQTHGAASRVVVSLFPALGDEMLRRKSCMHDLLLDAVASMFPGERERDES